MRNHGFIGGIKDFESLARLGVLPAAVDQGLARLTYEAFDRCAQRHHIHYSVHANLLMLIPPATDPAESKERDTGFSDRDPMGQVPPTGSLADTKLLRLRRRLVTGRHENSCVITIVITLDLKKMAHARKLPTSPELPASPELPLLGRALRAATWACNGLSASSCAARREWADAASRRCLRRTAWPKRNSRRCASHAGGDCISSPPRGPT